MSLEGIWKPWISLVLYEHAISSLSSTEHTTATVFISTGFLQCPHLKIPKLKQGLETNLVSSVNTAMWAYHATLSSQSTLHSATWFLAMMSVCLLASLSVNIVNPCYEFFFFTFIYLVYLYFGWQTAPPLPLSQMIWNSWEEAQQSMYWFKGGKAARQDGFH